jgi:NitT/TauT family transport system ATP-binding protein
MAPPSTQTAAAVKIRATGVERLFDSGRHSLAALGPVDLDIHEGEFVCLVGPSGCGKSTLLRIIGGLLAPSKGEIGISTRSRQATAMVFQEYSIFPWKTVEANIRFGLDVARIPKAERTRRARELAGRVGIGDFLDAYPATLSGGMKQRVSIARALAVEPEVLLMDEPFAALDAQMRLVMQDQLLELWESDRRTVVFVTHSLEEAILLGDRVIVMSARPGRILRDLQSPFPRPRRPEIRGEPAFGALQEEVWELLRGEVEKTQIAVEPTKR